MKNVLITGGSRGIGAECVREFINRSYRVFFLYKENDEKAQEIVNETGAVAFKCDVSSSSDVSNIASKIKGICDIDIIVNNAGISQIKMFCDITEDDWDNMFNVNMKSIYNICQAFLPAMVNKKWGRIINVSSMWGETGASCETHYSASKAAVIGFAKALAKELAPSNITVNCVSPGVIKTDMNSEIDEDSIKALCEEIPIKRIGMPKEVAETIAYLAGESGDYITGQVIGVNGGMVI